MCCRVTVEGASIEDPEVVAVLRAAGMRMDPYHPYPLWARRFGDGPPIGPTKGVTASGVQGGVRLTLDPPIGDHSIDKHRVNALTGSFMFELAAAIGERLGATVTQNSLVGQCAREVDGKQSRHDLPSVVIGDYPRSPMRFGHICLGFRAVLDRGVDQETGDAAATEPVARVSSIEGA